MKPLDFIIKVKPMPPRSEWVVAKGFRWRFTVVVPEYVDAANERKRRPYFPYIILSNFFRMLNGEEKMVSPYSWRRALKMRDYHKRFITWLRTER
jgi:hypothetical protein